MFWILLILGLVLLVVGYFNNRGLLYAGVALLVVALIVLVANNSGDVNALALVR